MGNQQGASQRYSPEFLSLRANHPSKNSGEVSENRPKARVPLLLFFILYILLILSWADKYASFV
jgi:hypothetical protein